jgi:hypothetical protein
MIITGHLGEPEGGFTHLQSDDYHSNPQLPAFDDTIRPSVDPHAVI